MAAQKLLRALSFKKFVHLCLAFLALESSAYFSKYVLFPSPIFAQVQESTQAAVTISEPQSFKLPILIYHYVEYVTDERDTIRKSLNIEPHIFEAQIQTLEDAGYTFIIPSQIAVIESGRYKIQKPAILSFDDGYRDFYTDVFPILKKHKVRAVAYVNPGLLDKLNYMSWGEVRELVKSGLVEIGSHGMSHRSLTALDEKTLEWEVLESKSILEKNLAIPVTAFAYPYGHYDENVAKIVHLAGFTTAITTDEGTNKNTQQKFLLKRIHPGLKRGQDLINSLDLLN